MGGGPGLRGERAGDYDNGGQQGEDDERAASDAVNGQLTGQQTGDEERAALIGRAVANHACRRVAPSQRLQPAQIQRSSIAGSRPTKEENMYASIDRCLLPEPELRHSSSKSLLLSIEGTDRQMDTVPLHPTVPRLRFKPCA